MSERNHFLFNSPVDFHKWLTSWFYGICKNWLMAGNKISIRTNMRINGFKVEIASNTRSLEQNAKMWAMLGEISAQVDWYGQRLTAEEWKDVFTASLKKQRAVPGLDGGFVVLGERTREMSIKEMSEVIELCLAFGAQKEVKFKYVER